VKSHIHVRQRSAGFSAKSPGTSARVFGPSAARISSIHWPAGLERNKRSVLLEACSTFRRVVLSNSVTIRTKLTSVKQLRYGTPPCKCVQVFSLDTVGKSESSRIWRFRELREHRSADCLPIIRKALPDSTRANNASASWTAPVLRRFLIWPISFAKTEKPGQAFRLNQSINGIVAIRRSDL
jgi:hypothetical protein